MDTLIEINEAQLLHLPSAELPALIKQAEEWITANQTLISAGYPYFQQKAQNCQDIIGLCKLAYSTVRFRQFTRLLNNYLAGHPARVNVVKGYFQTTTDLFVMLENLAYEIAS